MASLDERAASFRDAMVAGLPELGISDARVLDAMRAVPRHCFVDRFLATPPGSSSWSFSDLREWTVDDDADDDTLLLVHDGTRALPAPGFEGFDVVTSVSAPNLVAEMLQKLELRPGLRVLEIGAGSGYNAALIAHLVGDPSLVTSVDIDESLIEPARRRLTRLGCALVEVVHGDGDEGVAARAPYDRIVATVGCNDLSPAWFEQLDDDGFILCPTRHGGAHPIVRATHDHSSTFVSPSGFLKIRGRQDQDIWWPVRAPGVPESVEWQPARFQDLHPEEAHAWEAALYVALRDHRATGPFPGLANSGSVAIIQHERGLGRAGPDGDVLASRLAALLDDWDALGRPTFAAYEASWKPRTGDAVDNDRMRGPWRVPRVHHDQLVTLRRA